MEDETAIFNVFDSHFNDHLTLRSAACWIAFQSFEMRTSSGLDTLFSILDGGETELAEGTKAEGKYEMAEEQIIIAAENGLIRIFGKLVDEYKTESSKDYKKPDDLLGSTLVRQVPAEDFQSDFYLTDGKYQVGDYLYDELAVSWENLLEVFAKITPETVEVDSVTDNDANPTPLNVVMGKPKTRNRGRPQKWDWEIIITEIVLHVSTRGLPETQAALEVWTATKCQELFGAEPSISMIRSKIAPIYMRIRQKSL